MVFGDMAAVRRTILAEIGLQFPILFMLPMTRALWLLSNVDENSDLFDSSGQGRTLSETGTVTYSFDEYMPYAVLNGTTQYFKRADEAGLDITGALTMGGWFYFDNTASADEFIIGKWQERNNRRSYALKRNSSGKIVAIVSSNGTAETTVTSTDTVASGVWVLVVLRYEPSNELSVFVGQEGGSGGTMVENSNTSSIPASLNSDTAKFAVGVRDI